MMSKHATASSVASGGSGSKWKRAASKSDRAAVCVTVPSALPTAAETEAAMAPNLLLAGGGGATQSKGEASCTVSATTTVQTAATGDAQNKICCDFCKVVKNFNSTPSNMNKSANKWWTKF